MTHQLETEVTPTDAASSVRLLAKLHHFTAKLTVTRAGKVVARRTVSFRATPKHRKR